MHDKHLGRSWSGKERLGLFGGVKLNVETGCWNWIGPRSHGRYGVIRFHRKREFVHRVTAHLYLKYDMKSPLRVLHKCDNEQCCNPKHLFIGTQLDNVRDAIAKGRMFSSCPLFCPHGHRYVAANIQFKKDGKRQCKKCIAAYTLKRYDATHIRLTPEQWSELQGKKGRRSWIRGQGNRVQLRDVAGKFTEVPNELQARQEATKDSSGDSQIIKVSPTIKS